MTETRRAETWGLRPVLLLCLALWLPALGSRDFWAPDEGRYAQVAQEMLNFDVWVMLGAVVVLLPVMMTGWRIGRREGAAFLIAYGIYVAMKYEPAVVGG